VIKKAGITCTTVGVATHGVNENKRMETMAFEAAKGGKFYEVKDANKLPAIYIQETRRVSQSFIYDARFNPKMVLRGGPTDQLETNLPDLFGFVRTTRKNSPLVEVLIEGPRTFDQVFPVLAAWQYGLGRSVAFTSDARSQPQKVEGWDRRWAGSDMYRKFWEQVIGWAIRGVETERLSIATEYRDGRVRWTVEARDEANQPITNLRLDGGVTQPNSGPDTKPAEIRFEQKAPGIYEAELKAEEAGTYLLNAVARQTVTTYKGRSKENLSSKLIEKDGKLFLEDGTEVKKNPEGTLLYADDNTPVVEQKAGEKVVDSQRTAVTISYSPEFNDLESNPALMTKLSKITGGNIYLESDAQFKKIISGEELFRPGLATSRSLQTVWPWLVFLAGCALLADVGTRRINLDPQELNTYAQQAWNKLRTVEMAESKSDDFLNRLRQKKTEVAETIDQGKSERKFEATLGNPATYVPPPGADSILDNPAAPVLKPKPATTETKPTDKTDDFFSKLKKAKKRAATDTDNPEENKS
jgi:hypothetical protein